MDAVGGGGFRKPQEILQSQAGQERAKQRDHTSTASTAPARMPKSPLWTFSSLVWECCLWVVLSMNAHTSMRSRTKGSPKHS